MTDPVKADTHDSLLIPVKSWTETQIAERLFELGWIDQDKVASGFRKAREYYEAIRNFQKFHGLLPDEIVGPQTLRALFALKRCGLPDVMHARDQMSKWPFKDKVVPILNRVTLTQLTRNQILDAFEHTCREWNRVCGIKLSMTNNASQAWIIADTGRGPQDNFDGTGGTLAWSYLPNPSRAVRVQQKYDFDERWEAAMFRNTCLHETGHSIGVGHLEYGNVMQPTSDSSLTTLQAGDVEQGVLRYGLPEATAEPDPGNNNVPNNPDLIGRTVTVTIQSIS